jgi:hypothetical protein
MKELVVLLGSKLRYGIYSTKTIIITIVRDR